LFGGRRVYAKVFYATLDTSGPTRLNRPIMLGAPNRDEMRADVEARKSIVENLVSGRTSGPDRVEESPILTAMLDAFAAAAKARRPMSGCAAAAIEAAGEAHVTMLRSGYLNPEGGEGAEPPVTDLLPMLEATSAASLLGGADPGMPATPVNTDAMRMLMAIEASAWIAPRPRAGPVSLPWRSGTGRAKISKYLSVPLPCRRSSWRRPSIASLAISRRELAGRNLICAQRGRLRGRSRKA
jgi:hypothetical protein